MIFDRIYFTYLLTYLLTYLPLTTCQSSEETFVTSSGLKESNIEIVSTDTTSSKLVGEPARNGEPGLLELKMSIAITSRLQFHKNYSTNLLLFLIHTLITWLCEINLTSLYKHRVFLVKSTGSLKSTGT